jgi:hypothetical protein
MPYVKKIARKATKTAKTKKKRWLPKIIIFIWEICLKETPKFDLRKYDSMALRLRARLILLPVTLLWQVSSFNRRVIEKNAQSST